VIERRAQREHLAAYRRVRASAVLVLGFRLDADSLFKDNPDLPVRSPDHAAGEYLPIGEPELEVLGHTETALHLERRALVGQPAYDAIDRRLAKIGDDFPCEERPFRNQAGHSQPPTRSPERNQPQFARMLFAAR
jgi:hypothetical protein